MIHKSKLVGFLIFSLFLIVNLITLKDYGLSWDYHFHYYGGLFHLGMNVPKVSEKTFIPYSPPDPRLTIEDPFGPFMQIIPTFSQVILSDSLQLLPFDLAYNLPNAVFGSIGILIIYFLALDLFGMEVAVLSALFLALHPYYFGYLHNNMKDIPNAAAFACSLWLFYRLIKFKNLKYLILSSLAFAFAFNIKINAVLIPVVCGIYFLLINFKKLLKYPIILTYFILSPLFALALWWPFWRNPLEKLLEMPKFYSLNTFNMPVQFFGNIVHSGINIPITYPYVYLAITTPLPMILFFVIGLVFSLFLAISKKPNYIFILCFFFVPLLRYLSPQTSAIDGIRHFLEVLFPLSIISALGIKFVFRKLNSKYRILIHAFITVLLVFNIVKYHPYQTSFFNSLIGGIRGASLQFDVDFWGTPQKEAVLWLNKNAPSDSYVHIVMAQSTASLYLRPDLAKYVNSKSISESDFIVLLNRKSFFDLYQVNNLPVLKQREAKIVYQKNIDGIPLVWVFRK